MLGSIASALYSHGAIYRSSFLVSEEHVYFLCRSCEQFVLTMFLSSTVFVLLTGLTHAQFPSAPVDVEVVTSKLDPDVKLSYKEVCSRISVLLTVLTLWPGPWGFL